MWFLQVDTLLLLLGLSLLWGIGARIAGKHDGKVFRVMPFVELAILGYISKELLVLHIGYILFTWVLILLLRKCTKGRKFWFAFLCFACCMPVIYVRIATFYSLPAAGLTLTGFIYSMLKAIDVLYYEYYSDQKANFEIYANYMLFLPVLTAGPVFRYRDFQMSWLRPSPLDGDRLTTGTKRIIMGLFKKVVLATVVTEALSYLMGLNLRWYHSLIIPLVSLAVLYFDMAGYADVAIGMGHIVGIKMPENFKKPFQAPSFNQFWRNWHATVSDWIREHVFILFNNKKLNKWHGALISMVVMQLMSLWRGFSWMNVLDGLILGLILAFEVIFGITTVNKRKAPKWYFQLRCAIVIYLFALDTMLFTLSTSEIKMVIKGLLTIFGGGLS